MTDNEIKSYITQVTIEDISTPQSSNLSMKDVEHSDGIYPLYGASGWVKNIGDYQQDQDYVAIVKDGSGIGRVEKLPAKSSILGTMQYLLPKAKVQIDYLRLALQSRDLAKYKSGASIPHIYYRDYKNEKINFYPEIIQKEIINRIAIIEDLITKQKQQIRLLDDSVKSRFIELIGDPLLNPFHWRTSKIGDIAVVRIGPFGSLLHADDYVKGAHPLVNPSHLINGEICTDSDFSVTENKYIELEPYHLFPGDVILGRRGEIGRCAVVKNSGLLCGTGSMIIRLQDDLRPEVLSKTMQFPTFRRLLNDVSVGQTMPNLNAKIVSSLTVPIPSYSVQKQFIHICEQVDKSKLAIQKSIEELELLKKKLMQEYFG